MPTPAKIQKMMEVQRVILEAADLPQNAMALGKLVDEHCPGLSSHEYRQVLDALIYTGMINMIGDSKGAFYQRTSHGEDHLSVITARYRQPAKDGG